MNDITPAERFAAHELRTLALGTAVAALDSERRYHYRQSQMADDVNTQRAATVCAMTTDEAIAEVIAVHAAGQSAERIAAAIRRHAATLRRTTFTVEGITEPLAVDAGLMPYRRCAAAELAQIACRIENDAR